MKEEQKPLPPRSRFQEYLDQVVVSDTGKTRLENMINAVGVLSLTTETSISIGLSDLDALLRAVLEGRRNTELLLAEKQRGLRAVEEARAEAFEDAHTALMKLKRPDVKPTAAIDGILFWLGEKARQSRAGKGEA